MDEQLNVRREAIEEFYDVGEQIGSGQFAVVKKLHSKSSGETFAAKFMKKKRSKALKRGMTQEQFLREADVLRSVDHKGVIYLHDIFETKLDFVLVLELLSGGELFEFLSEQEFLTEDEAVGFLKQVIEAIDYLHNKSIVHLDIKPENIVLKQEKSCQIKLIDFGLARKLTEGEMVREIMGTPEFVAPEIIAFDAVGTETDMWAIGVLTYIMLSGASPFLGDDVTETFSNISMVDYEFDDEYFKDISEPAKDFISNLLVKNKSERLNAEECLKHEWMQDFEDQESPSNSEDDFVSENLITESPRKTNSLKKRRSTLIKTDAFKAFTARARWQKSLNKVIAISRLALLGKKNGPIQRQTSSADTTKTLANSDTSEKHDNDSQSNKIEDFAHIEGKLMKMEVNSVRDEEKVASDIISKEHIIKKETMVENGNRDYSGSLERSKKTTEENNLSHIEGENNVLQGSTTKSRKPSEKNTTFEMLKYEDRKPELPVCEQDKQVKHVISDKGRKDDDSCHEKVLRNTEVSIENDTKREKHKRSNNFENLRSKFSSKNGERRASGESPRNRQQLESAEASQISQNSIPMPTVASRSSKDHPEFNTVRATFEGIDQKYSEDSVLLKKQGPFSLNRDRRGSLNNKKGFISTRDEILKWERRNSSEPTPKQSFTSRVDVKKAEDKRLSLPVISKRNLKEPNDGRGERNSLRVVRDTTTETISPEKEVTGLNSSTEFKDSSISKLEITQHNKVTEDLRTMPGTATYTFNTNRSSLTRMQGSTLQNEDDEDSLTAIIDKEHTFVIQASLQNPQSGDLKVEPRIPVSVDGETDSSLEEQSERRVSSAFIEYKLGGNEMEGFPELSLTLQKSPTSPGDKEDQFVWLVTKEKNERRDFLTRVLAPKVQAAKNAPFQEDVFQKRRIRHKPIGEKGPPKARSASISSPAVSTSQTEIRIKHHSVPTGPALTRDGKHVPTVQLSSDMPALSFKIQMGEIKLADP